MNHLSSKTITFTVNGTKIPFTCTRTLVDDKLEWDDSLEEWVEVEGFTVHHSWTSPYSCRQFSAPSGFARAKSIRDYLSFLSKVPCHVLTTWNDLCPV